MAESDMENVQYQYTVVPHTWLNIKLLTIPLIHLTGIPTNILVSDRPTNYTTNGTQHYYTIKWTDVHLIKNKVAQVSLFDILNAHYSSYCSLHCQSYEMAEWWDYVTNVVHLSQDYPHDCLNATGEWMKL